MVWHILLPFTRRGQHTATQSILKLDWWSTEVNKKQIVHRLKRRHPLTIPRIYPSTLTRFVIFSHLTWSDSHLFVVILYTLSSTSCIIVVNEWMSHFSPHSSFTCFPSPIISSHVLEETAGGCDNLDFHPISVTSISTLILFEKKERKRSWG